MHIQAGTHLIVCPETQKNGIHNSQSFSRKFSVTDFDANAVSLKCVYSGDASGPLFHDSVRARQDVGTDVRTWGHTLAKVFFARKYF